MRGRVIAILMAIIFGGTPIGSPIAGWVADHFGPRWAMGVGALSGLIAAAAAAIYLCEDQVVLQTRIGMNSRQRADHQRRFRGEAGGAQTSSHSLRTAEFAPRSAGVPSNTIRPWPMT